MSKYYKDVYLANWRQWYKNIGVEPPADISNEVWVAELPVEQKDQKDADANNNYNASTGDEAQVSSQVQQQQQ